ncbi:hypothetical protein A6P54_17635 [Bacillus sp. MKU004]|nr:hypothetical protein A6P54_17635 [Bacillus sp. MKU004]
MKNIQAIIAIPSVILLFISLFFHLPYLFYIAIPGIVGALVIKQIRLRDSAMILGNPDRSKYQNGDLEDDSMEMDVDGSDQD